MNERRKVRLLREAIGDEHGTLPDADGFLRAVGIIALVLFVVVFSGTGPA